MPRGASGLSPSAEPTVRRYVRQRKRELGLSGREVFVPQSYKLGQEAQVDWFEGMAILGGEVRKLQFFAMRSMGSGDAFHRAYPHATQQALLEAHEHAFNYFGGVFKTLRYDNMTSVVKKILRGYQRVETERIIAFRSHWGYRERVLQPGQRQRKRRRGRRAGLVPAQLAGARAGGQCVRHVERTYPGCLPGEPKPHYRWPRLDGRSGQ